MIGPNLVSAWFQSGDIIKDILLGNQPGIPKYQMNVVDVRDVAQAHLQAILVDEAKGNRILTVSDDIWMSDIAKVLKTHYGKIYKVTTMGAPKIGVVILAMFDRQLQDVKKGVGKKVNFDNSKSKQLLNLEYIGYEKTLVDMVEALIATGYIPDKRKAKI